MKLHTDWLHDPQIQTVMAALQARGNQALFVGGCVRNGLLNEPVTDIDISTDATPDLIIALAKDAGLKSVPTGIDHGTITILVDQMPFEVTSFRKDIETDGRRAVVAFSTNIDDDARRRDFTMNAIYARDDGTIVDPLDGMGDLENRHVRFIEDPNQRIAEDYLRILRFFRFTAQYGDPELGIDADGYAACAAGLEGLQTLAKERIGAEMRKLLSVKNPAPVLAAMEKSGILTTILRGAEAKFISILIHIEQGRHSNWLTRLVCLGGENPDEAFRLTKVEAKNRAAILHVIETGQRPSHAAYAHGADVATASVFALAALIESDLPLHWQDQIALGASAIFPVKAIDIMHLEGKALGAQLRQLETKWMASDFTLTKEALLDDLC